MKYKVNVYFTAYRQYEIEADNEADAKDKAYGKFENESVSETLYEVEYVENSADPIITDE